ncbi:MAG: HIT domain-containing protein [Gaiellaceae bacterium]
MVTECAICEKHRGKGFLVGELVYEDENVFVNHAPVEVVNGYIGYLFVDAKRHVRGLAELSDEEASAIALMVSRLARALESEGAEHVYAFVFNHIPHHHVHVVARHPGTPREFWGPRVDEWEDAPRGNEVRVASYCDRLRLAL